MAGRLGVRGDQGRPAEEALGPRGGAHSPGDVPPDPGSHCRRNIPPAASLPLPCPPGPPGLCRGGGGPHTEASVLTSSRAFAWSREHLNYF